MRRRRGVFRNLGRIRGEGGDDRLMTGVVVWMTARWMRVRSSFYVMCALRCLHSTLLLSRF